MANEEETKCSYTPEGEDCPKHGKKCCKSEEKKRKKGMYGLDDEGDRDDASEDNGSMPQDNANEARELIPDVHLKGMSSEKKKKAMDKFRERSSEAAKRKKDKETKNNLAHERMTKGIRFFDSKGSGYIRDGKKNYD
mgnify:CR=1 FL=1